MANKDTATVGLINAYEENKGKLTITKTVSAPSGMTVPDNYEVVITVTENNKTYYLRNSDKALIEINGTDEAAKITAAKSIAAAKWNVPTAANS